MNVKTTGMKNLRSGRPSIPSMAEAVAVESDDLSRFEGEGGSQAPAPAAEWIDIPLENAVWRRPCRVAGQTNPVDQ